MTTETESPKNAETPDPCCQTAQTAQAASCDCEPAPEAVREVRPAWRSRDDGEGVTLDIALPGVLRDDLNISAKESHVTVKARRTENLPAGWTPRQEAGVPESYTLKLRLSPDLDPSTTEARLRDGVLRLSFARREEAKPRSIPVEG